MVLRPWVAKLIQYQMCLNQRTDILGFQSGVLRTGGCGSVVECLPAWQKALDVIPNPANKQEIKGVPQSQCIHRLSYRASGGQKTPLALSES